MGRRGVRRGCLRRSPKERFAAVREVPRGDDDDDDDAFRNVYCDGQRVV